MMERVQTGQKCKDNFCEKTWNERDYLEGKTVLGRPWTRWDENIKINLKETKYEGVGQVPLTQNMQ